MVNLPFHSIITHSRARSLDYSFHTLYNVSRSKIKYFFSKRSGSMERTVNRSWKKGAFPLLLWIWKRSGAPTLAPDFQWLIVICAPTNLFLMKLSSATLHPPLLRSSLPFKSFKTEQSYECNHCSRVPRYPVALGYCPRNFISVRTVCESSPTRNLLKLLQFLVA